MAERGVTLTEYALVMGVVTLGVIASVRALGLTLGDLWGSLVAAWTSLTP